jgi:hypothetical protein
MFQPSCKTGGIELSLAVVGLEFPNTDETKSNRLFEARLCKPGDLVRLVPEPKNPVDPRAVAVFSERGVQLGYLTAERCGWIGGKIASGEPVAAIFQDLQSKVAVIRARFGGEEPTLPALAVEQPSDRSANEEDFYPDPPAPDWGA